MGILETIGLAIIAIASAAFYGMRKGRKDAERKQDEAYIETRKRMDAVAVDADDGVLREWLQDRGER